MDRDSAIIYMVDSNLKRENISPMVKARAYTMKLEAIDVYKRQQEALRSYREAIYSAGGVPICSLSAADSALCGLSLIHI